MLYITLDRSRRAPFYQRAKELELERSTARARSSKLERDVFLTSAASLVYTSNRPRSAPRSPRQKARTAPRVAAAMPPDRRQRAGTASQSTRAVSPSAFAALPQLACKRASHRFCVNHELVQALAPLRDERFLLYGSKSPLKILRDCKSVAESYSDAAKNES